MASYKPKVCPVCGEEFKPTSSAQKYCSVCGERTRREKKREYGRKYYKKNREKICEYQREHSREYYWEHREKVLERVREHYRANKEKKDEYKAWYNNGGKLEVMMRKKAEEVERAMKDNSEWGKDWRETSRLADVKPEACKFDGPCVECPYPECVED